MRSAFSQVSLDLDPTPQGFTFRAGGGSVAGRFDARGAIRSTPGQPTIIDMADLAVTGTHAKGSLRSDPGGFTGRLDLAGGGISGAIAFAPQGLVQRIEPHLVFTQANLAAATPIFVRRGRADAAILLDPAGVAIDGSFTGTGIARGTLGLARASGEAHLKGRARHRHRPGCGQRRPRLRYHRLGRYRAWPIALAAQGIVESRPDQARRARRADMGDDLWQLSPVRLEYAGGTATVSGSFAKGSTSFEAGSIICRSACSTWSIRRSARRLCSGKLSFHHVVGTAPSGRIDVAVRGMTRSGAGAELHPGRSRPRRRGSPPTARPRARW